MNSAHQATDDAEVVVDNLGQGGEAVGRAAGVGDDLLAAVAAVIHPHHEHRGLVLGGGTHHHPLGAGLNVGAGQWIRQEEARALQHGVNANGIPLQVAWIALRRDPDDLSIHHQLSVLDLDLTLETAMGGVVAKQIGQVIDINQVIDASNLNAWSHHRPPEGQASDATKTIDANPDGQGSRPNASPQYSACSRDVYEKTADLNQRVSPP